MLSSPPVRVVRPRCAAMLAAALALSIMVAPLLGQVDTAGVSGSVVDSTNAYVSGASIVLQNTSTGAEQTTTTNKDGAFSLGGILPGHYQLLISAKSFADTKLQNIVLNVGDERSLQIKLRAGALAQAVDVNGSGMTLNTTDASVSTVIDRQFAENIPLNGRSFQDLISMTPGVVTQSPQNTSQAIGDSGDFSVNGQRTESNYYTVDGVAANISAGNGGGVGEAATGGTVAASTALGTTQSLISVDALQEFRVESSTYSAEYGRSPGGQFAMVTRSGTNTLHGSAFDYLRNNVLDANDWFNDHYGDPAPALRQNDFGGTVGGPVWISKVYSEANRTFFFASYEGLRLTLPTAATIQYVPDLFLRQQAEAAMQPILNALPLPNGVDYGTATSPGLAQFIAPYSLPSTINSTSIRLDQTLGTKLELFFRYGNTTSSVGTRENFARTTASSNVYTYTFGATSQLSNHVNDEFRLGYADADSSQIGVLDSFGGASPANLNDALGAGSFAAVEPVEPYIILSVPGAGGYTLLAPYYGKNLGRQWNIVDTFSLAIGHHNVKFGADYRHIKSSIVPEALQVLAVFVTAPQILSGTPLEMEPTVRKQATPLFNEGALFIQDEWRVRPNLSLSMGLRWEVDPPPTEEHGDDAYTLFGSLSDPSSLSLAPQGTPLWKTTWYNFAPRLGVAWTAHNQPGLETVVRAGGGVFFDSANDNATLGYSNFGFSAYNVQYGIPVPFTVNELTAPISTTPPYTASIIVAFPPHLQLPYTLEWNTSIQQAFGPRQTVTLSYVGSNGRRLLGEQYLSLNALNANFGEVEYFPANLTSSYNSLQVEVQRPVARGLQALASYSWSHSIDFGSQATELPLQRGDSDFDVRSNFQAGITWDLPSIRGAKIMKLLLESWGVDARFMARTAFPVTLGGNETVNPATGSIYDGGLNLVSGKPLYLYGSQYPGGRAINPAAFSVPPTGAGTAPRNFTRGFGEDQFNLAVRREFHLHDALNLQFRAEAFNVINHPNFGYVDPTYSDATFGQATQMLNASLGTMASQYQQGGPRSLQIALKLRF